jgi:acyl dehydratase
VSAAGIERFIGYRFPGGTYTVAPDKHALFLDAVDGIASGRDCAHPVMHFIATHAGKGMTFEKLMDLIGAPLDAGALFGQEDLEIFRPVRVGETVAVRGGIVDAQTKTGAKTGPFNTLTTEIELVDAKGEVVCRSRETYIIPGAHGVAAL